MSFGDFSAFKALFPSVAQSVAETFKELHVHLELEKDSFRLPESVAFDASLSFLNTRDKLKLSFLKADDDTFDYYGNDSSDFLERIGVYIADAQTPVITFQLTITKINIDGVLSIYSLNAFITYLEKLTLTGILYDFNQQLKAFTNIVFEVSQLDSPLKTATIYITSQLPTSPVVGFDRQPVIDKVRNNCNFNLSTKYDLAPQDFFIESVGDTRLSLIFNKVSEIYALLFLFDSATVTDDLIEYKLNGYKTITGTVDFKRFQPDAKRQYYQIYQWVYSSGNFIDKIGLARNIISLNLAVTGNARLSGNALESIRSGYKVYEKQNIKQYIEVRNKISDQLLSFHDRANKILETFASGFQKSALALISFYISAIVLKTLNKDKLTDVFTWDASLLTTGFIGCAWLYFRACKWEMNAQTIRFKTHYKDLKKRYTDLLTAEDIQTILNDDEDFKNDVAFIQQKGQVYTRLWLGIMLILLTVTWSLYLKYHY